MLNPCDPTTQIRLLVTDPDGKLLTFSPDLPVFLGQPLCHPSDLLADLPADIVHQVLPLADGSIAHSFTRAEPDRLALQRSNVMLRETLDAIDGPVVVYSADLTYVFGNTAYHAYYPHLPCEADLIGKTYDQVLGLSMQAGVTLDPLGREDPAAFIAERRAAMLARVDSNRESHDIRRGRWSTVRTAWTPGGNRVTLRVDITPLKRLQHELVDTQRMKTVGHISGGVAHNFNNLLTVIISNIEMLLDDAGLAAESALLARRALSSAEAGARLVRQLLSFARRDFVQARPVNPNQMLADMIDLLRGAAGSAIPIELLPHRAVTEGARTDSAESQIEIDPAQFATAMMNLVLNARDAVQAGIAAGTTSHGRIRISITRATTANGHEIVLIRVADNGCGMSSEVAAAAFDPFFTTKGLAVASGLGLSQVHGFVVGAGGEVRIQSVPNSGTSVEMQLPAITAQPA